MQGPVPDIPMFPPPPLAPAPQPGVRMIAPFVRTQAPLEPQDSLVRAASLLRLSPLGLAPVLDQGRIVGTVDQACLRPDNGRMCDAAELARVENVMRPIVVTIPIFAPPDIALQMLDAHRTDVMPVVDHSGRYRGLIARADLVLVTSGVAPPERIGGMATPLGVYLTSGTARGGVGDLALFLSGLSLFCFMVLAWAVVFAITWFLEPNSAINLALLGPTTSLPWAWLAVGAMMGLLFRTSPLAGYHAAEHQVVHAVERGEDLVPERVSRMPRVHPRCGTNLVIVGVTATAIVMFLGGTTDGVVVAVIVALIARYPLGGLAQYFVTTKPAGEAELRSGIRAAEDLIERHQAVIGKALSPMQRVWAMGLIQVGAGLLIPMWAFTRLLNLIGIPLPF